MSRDVADLDPWMQGKARDHIDLMAECNVPILIYCTKRTHHEQARLYRQGRPYKEIHHMAETLSNEYRRPDLAEILLSVGAQHGPVRTHAAPGQSIHEYGWAYDACPMRNGEPVWGDSEDADAKLWALYGKKAQELGLEWGGDWTGGFVDKPHVQKAGLSWRDLI